MRAAGTRSITLRLAMSVGWRSGYKLSAMAIYEMYRNTVTSRLFSVCRCLRNTQPITIAHPLVAMHIAYDLRYVGPHVAGHTYLLNQYSLPHLP